uniref:P-type phospholipid transporter n=1 Tax=Panthera tigris altaica TaxID=74533 RepID=A0A8C9J9W0_PANTA
MGDAPGRGGPVFAALCDAPLSLASAFTWELEANSRDYNSQFKEKSFLCWQRRKHKSNVIHTAKYNVFSFLPLNLYEQFHRVSNLYFLFIIILQGLPEISTLPWFTLFVPLICLLVIRATRDLVDDIVSGRGAWDPPHCHPRPCSFLWRKWEDLYVGDVVCLHKDNIVPADLLLLASTEPSSLCYVETADIDGETNLKFRQAPPVTHHELTSIRKMASFQGKVVCEEPNSRLHHFVGCLEWNGRKHPLDIGNVLLRGCKVRNTDTCYGLVIYADANPTGFDTKIMRNCGKIHLKRSRIDRLLNRLVALVRRPRPPPSSSGPPFPSCAKVHHDLSRSRTLNRPSHPDAPLSLFLKNMYLFLRERKQRRGGTRGTEDLKWASRAHPEPACPLPTPQGNPYLWNKFADGKFPYRNAELLRAVQGRTDEAVREFWRLLAICHTVMVQEKDRESDQPVYQAASPDEEALVTAARNFGYVFVARTQDSITVMELGDKRVYQVLAMMDFNNMRKRMSVLVRNPEGAIYLYTKGADVVIFERLSKKGMTEWTTEEALASFAEETLRTLCLAYKRVDEDTYEEWRQRHREASLRLQNRAHALHQVYEEMERGLQLLGATAIEDRLQDGVCDTIQCLKQGNIKVWVLTGDKQETAVNIGFACQLLSENMLILEEKEITHPAKTRTQRRSFETIRLRFPLCLVLFRPLSSLLLTTFSLPLPCQPLYEGWFLALFNLLFSTLPVLYIGLFEQDVSAERSLELPQLYIAGQKDELFNYWVFLQALAHGTATSLVNFFVTLWVSHDSAGPTSFSDYQSFSVVVALSSLLSITMEAILIIKYWTVLSVLAIFLSFCFYVVVTWGCQSFWLFQISPENFPFLYADRNVLSHPSILLVILLNVSLNTLPTLALRVIYQALEKPRPKEVEEAPSEDITAVEPAPYLRRES